MPGASAGSTRFWIALGGGAAALLVFWAVLVRPAAVTADAEAAEIERLLVERSRYFPADGKPIAEVRAELEKERRDLKALEGLLGRAELVLPPELEPGLDRGTLHFQKELQALRARAEERGITFAGKATALGFPEEVTAEEVPGFLARLAVAGRFLEAAAAAGVDAVVSAEQVSRHGTPITGRPIALRSGPGGPVEADERVEEIRFRVVAAMDEYGLVRLLQEISRPGRFLALEDLAAEVKDPDSGAFEATMVLAGIRTKEAPAGPGPEGAGPAPEEEPGTFVPHIIRTRRGRP
jgi:hypothetical protein